MKIMKPLFKLNCVFQMQLQIQVVKYVCFMENTCVADKLNTW